jgi:hypothetical protein
MQRPGSRRALATSHTVTLMRALSAHHYSNEMYVILILDDNAIVVVHPDPEDREDPATRPVDISLWAPDLLVLALVEPVNPDSSHPVDTADIAQISLLDAALFDQGVLGPVSPETASRCLALVCDPSRHHVEVVGADAFVKLVGSGLAIQVLSGVAAAATRDVDSELLGLLGEILTEDDPRDSASG